MCVCMRVCVYVRTSLETGSLASLLNFFSYKSLRLPTWEWKYTHPCCQDAYCHRFFFSFCCLFFCCFVLLLLQVVMVFYCFLSFFEGGQFKTGLLWVPLAAPKLTEIPPPLPPEGWGYRHEPPCLAGLFGFVCFEDRDSLCSLGWPGAQRSTCQVSWVLGLKVCTAMPRFVFK